jgi:hypothetical protein
MDKQAVRTSNINYQYMFNLFTINIYNKRGSIFYKKCVITYAYVITLVMKSLDEKN